MRKGDSVREIFCLNKSRPYKKNPEQGANEIGFVLAVFSMAVSF